MKRMTRMILAMAVPALLATGPAAQAQAPDYTNVHLVSINVTNRTLVIRNAQGTQETLQLDDNVAGFGNVQPGDRVILGIRNEPGHDRVTSIMKSTPSAPAAPAKPAAPATRTVVRTTPAKSTTTTTTVTTTTPGTPTAPAAVNAAQIQAAQAAFADQVAALAQQARSVDRLWSDFSTTCKATVTTHYDGARDWFGIWDDQVKADLSSGFCRDLFNQMVTAGEVIKKSMAGAEEVAGKTLEPGQVREVRRVNMMDWDGWTRPAPDRLVP